MNDKQRILADIQQALHAGVITSADLAPFVGPAPAPHEAEFGAVHVPEQADKHDKISAVDIMFYIAGIVLFAALMSIIVQSWDGGSAVLQILLSAGFGAGLWCAAFYLLKSPFQNDVRRGMVNSMLLTGSLSVVVGGYIIASKLAGGANGIGYIPASITLLVLSATHIGFDRLVKRDLILLFGVLLGVAAFPTLLFGFLQDASVPIDVWSIIAIISSGLLVYATRVVAKINPERREVRSSFDAFAVFLALAIMYASSFSNYGIAWLILLIASIFGIFYLSIISQNKHLLGNASFFMVLTVITISFKYFSGYGVTTSLIFATIGMLGSAAAAATINKKYFKQTPK
ncbi:MAG TPA: hypothetical protein VLF91_03095 [Candidatus Saccharimonadales bacterium]|nr:hypothetical protein [Candidatus Saccharimonadales bacterium]